MAWGRIDDDAWCHARFVEVRPNAYALYWAMNSYSNSQLLDGHFTEGHIKAVAGLRLLPYKAMRDAIDNLVSAGVWEIEPSGYHVHDYLDYNDSKVDILARREERAEAGRAGGKRSGEVRKQKAIEAKAKQQLESSFALASKLNGSKNEANANPVPGPVPTLITNVINTKVGTKEPAGKRPDQAMWDAFVETVGATPETLSERGKWNKGLKELRDAGVTSDDIPDLVAAYRSRFKSAACNPRAIANNLSEIRSQSEPPVYVTESLADHDARLERERTSIVEAGGVNPWSPAALAANPPFARMRTNGHSSARV